MSAAIETTITSMFDAFIKHSAMQFNVTAKLFLENLLVLFPNDSVVPVILQLLQPMTESNDLQQNLLPSNKFTISIHTNPQLASCIAQKDERMFADDFPVTIQLLEDLDFKKKWKVMDANNRNCAWQYLDSLFTLSAHNFLMNTAHVKDIIKFITKRLALLARKRATDKLTDKMIRGTLNSNTVTEFIRQTEIAHKYTEGTLNTLMHSLFKVD